MEINIAVAQLHRCTQQWKQRYERVTETWIVELNGRGTIFISYFAFVVSFEILYIIEFNFLTAPATATPLARFTTTTPWKVYI